MKTRIRTLALVLVFLFILPLFNGFAQATDDIELGELEGTATETQLEDAAIEYVDRYIETAFLYGNPNMTENTLLSLVDEEPIGASILAEETVMFNNVEYTLTDLWAIFNNLKRLQSI